MAPGRKSDDPVEHRVSWEKERPSPLGQRERRAPEILPTVQRDSQFGFGGVFPPTQTGSGWWEDTPCGELLGKDWKAEEEGTCRWARGRILQKKDCKELQERRERAKPGSDEQHAQRKSQGRSSLEKQRVK